MCKRLFLVISLLVLSSAANAQSPRMEWIKYLTQGTDSTIYSSDVYITADGSVYLAGADDSANTGDRDMILNKYSSTGTLIWQKRYAGPGNSNDNSARLFTDNNGFIYLTGSRTSGGVSCPAVVKYNASGDTIWARQIPELCTSVYVEINWSAGHSGDIYLAQTHVFNDSVNFKVAMFLNDGTLNWYRDYQGLPHDSAQVKDITPDNSGDVVITGLVVRGGYPKVLTMKYSGSDGIELWRNIYSGVVQSNDMGNSVAVDGNNNIVVTGQTLYPDDAMDFDFVTLKYSPDGDTLWTRAYGGHYGPFSNSMDLGTNVEIDGNNNIIVGGFTNGGEFGGDIGLIKYDPNGQLIWSKIFDGTPPERDFLDDIQVDADGSVVILGTTDQSDIADTGELLLLKYSSTGQQLWTKLFYGMGNSQELPLILARSPQGGSVVTGWTRRTWTQRSYYTIKYSDYVCGDASGDGAVNVSDVVFLIQWIFVGGPQPQFLQAADVNCDNSVNISDCVYILAYIFNGGPAPCANCK